MAPIPALTFLTGYQLSYPLLVTWVFTVSFAGVITALAIRRQMLDREGLPFPNGIATAETIMEVYATGREPAYRIKLLIGAGLTAGGVKLVDSFLYRIPSLGPPQALGFQTTPNVVAKGVDHVSWRALGLELQPSLLLFGFGAIVGPRVGVSLLLGTLLAWVFLPGKLLSLDWVQPAMGGTSWYESMLEWLLWPAVAEVLSKGLDTIPGGAGPAVAASILIGILLAVLEAIVPEKMRVYVPSASSLGFAFIIPPFISLAMFLGAMSRVVAEKIRPVWSHKYLIVIAAGLVAGESLAGILSALTQFIGL